MTKWRPIKSAPKDEKRRLLGFDPRFGIAIIKYDGWSDGGFDVDPGLIEVGDGGYFPYDYKPTHWLPLPAPPKVARAPS